MNAEYKISCMLGHGVNLLHITIGEKNFKDSLVILSPHGKGCTKFMLMLKQYFLLKQI